MDLKRLKLLLKLDFSPDGHCIILFFQIDITVIKTFNFWRP